MNFTEKEMTPSTGFVPGAAKCVARGVCYEISRTLLLVFCGTSQVELPRLPHAKLGFIAHQSLQLTKAPSARPLLTQCRKSPLVVKLINNFRQITRQEFKVLTKIVTSTITHLLQNFNGDVPSIRLAVRVAGKDGVRRNIQEADKVVLIPRQCSDNILPLVLC